MSRRFVSSRRGRAGQRGVVLFVALIVLVVMALTGLAMIRSSGSNLSIAGNVGFRLNAVSGADLGTEAAIAWWMPLHDVPGALDSDRVGEGYYSNWGDGEPARRSGDPSKYPWGTGQDKSVLVTSNDGTGNEVRYYIERLCLNDAQSPSNPAQQCIAIPIKDGNDKSGTCDNYPKACPPPTLVVQYRVSTRVVGPRNTVSYIQVMLTAV